MLKQRYYRAMTTMPSYSILSSSLPSAIAIVRFHADLSAMKLLFSKLPESLNTPMLTTCIGVDQGLLNREFETRWLFTPHGGLGVLEALRETMREAEVEELEADSAFVDEAEQQASPWRKRIQKALPDVESEASMRAMLDALACDQAPDDLDALLAKHTRLPLVLLCGLPNAGKSSLFNALVVDREVIVADQAGTTRDLICGRMELGQGFAAMLGDTPGLREDAESLGEAAGIALARNFAEDADLRIWLKTRADEPVPAWADAALLGKADLQEIGMDGVSSRDLKSLEAFRALLRRLLFPS